MNSILPFIPLFFIYCLGLISPGPDFIVIVKNALISRRTGIMTAIGLGLGMTVHVAYCLLGLAFIISQSILLFNFLKLLAALYLIFIGWKALRAKEGSGVHVEQEENQKELSAFEAIKIGFLTNVLNPKATIFFLGLFTVGIRPETPILFQIIFGIVMSLTMMIWFSIVALFFSHQHIRSSLHKFSKTINRVLGGLLIALGIKIALSHR